MDRIEKTVEIVSQKPAYKTTTIELDDHYKLFVRHHKTGERTWDYLSAKVFQGDFLATELVRNYHSFWYSLICRADGDYLLWGQDYQGYSVVDLDSGEVIDYIPEAASFGAGFCWIDVYPSPDKTKIAVLGCYWGFPEDILVFEISDIKTLPFKEIEIKLPSNYIDSFYGWVDNNSFVVVVDDENVKVDV